MIHAYLFVTRNNRDHTSHGPEFLKLMKQINEKAGTKISVYHSFHDEVDNYRKHIWRCEVRRVISLRFKLDVSDRFHRALAALDLRSTGS